MTLTEQANRVQTPEDLAALILALAAELKANPDAWENADLPSFLGAMAAWVQDMDGYYKNLGQDLTQQSGWSVIADMLMAARVYE